MESLIDLIIRLSLTPGIPGYEKEVVNIFKEELEDYVDKLTVDHLGNIIALSKGKKKNAPIVMVEVHTDEPGLNVKYIESEGFLRLELVGLTLLQALPFERVDIHGKYGSILGVVGAPGFHTYYMEMGGPKGPDKPFMLRDLFVDIGARDRREAEEMGAYIGAPVTFHREVERLGGNLITGKALDDRALCAVMIRTVQQLKEADHNATIYFVGAVQEEAANMGGGPAAYTINPDMTLILEVTIPGDYPGVMFRDFPLKVGGGVCIGVKDMCWDFALGNLAHPKIVELLIRTAEREKIPYQLENISGTATDASKIMVTGKGVPCGKISVPTRYTHSGSEVLSLSDLENTEKLLMKSLMEIDEGFTLNFL